VANKDLIVDVGVSEVSLALLEEKQLIELNKEKRNVKFSVGDIYLGKKDYARVECCFCQCRL
jgi:ribonuclease G